MPRTPGAGNIGLKTTNIFGMLEREAFRAGIAPRTQDSMDWFRRRAYDIRRLNRNEIMKDDSLELRNRSIIGNMYFYFYDPKHKKTLPYYDSFPLTIMVGPAKGGFYGLNIHYLPPVLRFRFFKALLDITNNKAYNETTRFNLTYGLLKSSSKFKEFRPCFKHYLTTHVRSRFAYIPPPEWEIAVALPAADWQKKSAQEVYRESRKLIQ